MKSLKELWIENGGKPFWAQGDHRVRPEYCIGFTLNQTAMVTQYDRHLSMEGPEDKLWTLCEDPTKPEPKMRVVRQKSAILDKGLMLALYVPEGWEDVTESLAHALKEYLE